MMELQASSIMMLQVHRWNTVYLWLRDNGG